MAILLPYRVHYEFLWNHFHLQEVWLMLACRARGKAGKKDRLRHGSLLLFSPPSFQRQWQERHRFHMDLVSIFLGPTWHLRQRQTFGHNHPLLLVHSFIVVSMLSPSYSYRRRRDWEAKRTASMHQPIGHSHRWLQRCKEVGSRLHHSMTNVERVLEDSFTTCYGQFVPISSPLISQELLWAMVDLVQRRTCHTSTSVFSQFSQRLLCVLYDTKISITTLADAQLRAKCQASNLQASFTS